MRLSVLVSTLYCCGCFWAAVSSVAAYAPLSYRPPSTSSRLRSNFFFWIGGAHQPDALHPLSSTTTSDEDYSSSRSSSSSSKSTTSRSFSAASSESLRKNDAPPQFKRSNTESSKSSTSASSSWQMDLERLLDPTTTPAQRQILLSNLLNANTEIQASVQKALRDRQIDPLLTPTGRKLQDGTRAVARQLTNDILPSLRPNNSNSAFPAIPLPPLPSPQEFSKFGNRFINAVSNQMQRNLAQLQDDLANPSQIPARISQQTEDFLQEASNIFAETPVGLQETPYTVLLTTEDYEIRDYPAYTVATTRMNLAEVEDTQNNAATAATEQGLAFNTLAAYIFGNNAEQKVLDMTTPVTTTASGDMRFYLATDQDNSAPPPLSEDAAAVTAATPWLETTEYRKIRLERIPPARLAVRRFGGFATAGEIARQKAQLLAALQLDDVALDVPHGQTVGHVIFQYNPPYTLPALRRNEIAVPVSVIATVEGVGLEDPWDLTTTNGAAPGTKLATTP